MTREIKYIADEVFTRMTKKQKFEIEQIGCFEEIEIDRLVITPMNSKSSGYFIGSFFAHTPNKGWWRSNNYDCWEIVTETHNPITPKFRILKGDFENGGFQIFGFGDEFCKAFISYGGRIIIKRK